MLKLDLNIFKIVKLHVYRTRIPFKNKYSLPIYNQDHEINCLTIDTHNSLLANLNCPILQNNILKKHKGFVFLHMFFSFTMRGVIFL